MSIAHGTRLSSSVTLTYQGPNRHATAWRNTNGRLSIRAGCPCRGPFSSCTAMAQRRDSVPGDKFLKGVGLSVWQNSFDSHSNWAKYIKDRNYFGQGEKWKDAWTHSCDFWNKYEEDIQLAKNLGATSFRFSFEWARIEPSGPGVVDEEAVDRFHKIIDCILANCMEPMATLHHFTHPQWFEERGGFLSDENVPLFVEFSARVFSWFGSKVTMWATFNEPTVFASVGYVFGLWCPGKAMQFNEAGRVICTLLKAHCATYRAIKALPGGDKSSIGLVHQHITFSAAGCMPWTPYVAKWMTLAFGARVILPFFTKGIFEWESPSEGVTVRYSDPDAPSTLDWFGMNYYSRPYVNWRFKLVPSYPGEPVSDVGMRIYPQGMYETIQECSVLGVPMYITETGIADRQDKYRRLYIESHYKMVLKAIADGYDVRGVFAWTLMDNIEWHEGFTMKYGLYEWDPIIQRSQGPPRLREGSKALVEIYNTWPDDVQAVRDYARQQEAKDEDERTGSEVSANDLGAVSSEEWEVRARLHVSDMSSKLQ